MLRVRVFQGGRQRFAGTAAQVVLPGEAGEVAVLAFHATMVCALIGGDVRIDETSVPVQGGIARVDRNAVTIIAE